MKKTLLTFMIIIKIIVAEIHPTLSLKGTGIGENSYEKLNITKLSFSEDKNYVNVNLENDNGEKYVLGRLEKNTEVLSVFYDDISGDTLKEVFLITRLDGKYAVEVYQEEFIQCFGTYEFDKVYPLSDYLSKIFVNEKNLNASKVRGVTKNLLPANYSSVGYWTQWEEENFYKGTDYYNGKLIAYYNYNGEKLSSIEEANNYLVDYGNNIYGIFSGSTFDGFNLLEIFQGKVEKGKIIKDGEYQLRTEGVYRRGQYVNGLEEGKWYDYLRGGAMYYYYEKGVEVKREVVDD